MAKKPTIDQDVIRELAALLKETDLSEIEVEQDDYRIRVARGGRSVEYAAPAPIPVSVATPVASAAPVSSEAHPGTIKSPMVGTAYMSPAPGEAAYVAVGDKVKAGQTIMIVEAMKTMNQISAPKAGTIISILVEDTQPVEFGEPLMIVE